MKVLFWSEFFWPYIGGSEVFATNLLTGLLHRGHEFLVFATHVDPRLPDKYEFMNIPVHLFPFRKAIEHHDIDQITAICEQISKLKREYNQDLIHMNSTGPIDIFHHLTEKAKPTPFILTLQQHLPPDTLTPRTVPGQTLRKSDWIVCCSDSLLYQTRELVPEVGSRSSTILNSIKEPELIPQPLPFETPILLCLGRLLYFKGFDIAVNAFSKVVSHFPKARLVIAGDGPMRSELDQQVNDLGLTEMTDFLGWVAPDKVPDLINAATLLLMPSRWEGLPLVALEAAMMARPIVATNVGGLKEAVSHGQTGFLVEPEDVSGFAEAVITFLKNPALAVDMGKTARRRAKEMFGFERHVDAYDQLYHRIGQKH